MPPVCERWITHSCKRTAKNLPAYSADNLASVSYIQLCGVLKVQQQKETKIIAGVSWVRKVYCASFMHGNIARLMSCDVSAATSATYDPASAWLSM